MTGKEDAQSPAHFIERVKRSEEESTVPLSLAYDRSADANRRSHAMTLRNAQHADVFEWLDGRVGPLHLKQRLGIEGDQEERLSRRGIRFFHHDNWYSVHGVIRTALRCSGLFGRACRNAMSIELRHNAVHVPDLPPAFDGFKVLHLTDLHLDMDEGFPEVLAERFQGLDYDLCVLTGDYRYRTFGPFDRALDGLRRVRAHLKDPVYGVLGNHDSIRMVPGIEALGIRLLLNESAALRRGDERIHLIGIDDPHYYRADNLERACRDIHPGSVSVLLSHSPEVYQHAAHAGIDVLLCGHTHGGQLCLPGGTPLVYDADCPRRMARGPWTYQGLRGYTSVGAGSSIVGVRLNCPPEITVHELRRG